MKLIKFRKLPAIDYVIYSLVIALGIALDQLTKWLAVEFLSPIPTYPLIEGVLHLTYVENKGAAFGMLADQRWIFMVISTVAILVLFLYLFGGFAQNKLYGVAMALIAAGGIGNMIDRISLGYVVDFVDFRLINFAVFNGADSFICIGAGLLILAVVRELLAEIRVQREKGKEEEK